MQHSNSISEFLESEHRWIDEKFAQFQLGLIERRIQGRPFDQAAELLHRHIFIEEEILFPQVEARGLVGPSQVMIEEHGQICDLLSTLRDFIEMDARPERLETTFELLHSLLEGHNSKEEQILYPAADQLLDKNELAKVAQRLKDAKVPEGWVCRAHRTSGV